MLQPGLVLDIVEDIRRMNDQALKAAPRKTGIIVLGGGAPLLLAWRVACCSKCHGPSLTRRWSLRTQGGHHQNEQ